MRRSQKLLLRPLMHMLNLLFRLFGDNINRETVKHVAQAGFVLVDVERRRAEVRVEQERVREVGIRPDSSVSLSAENIP